MSDFLGQGVTFDFDSIPDSLTLPSAVYKVQVDSVEEKYNDNGILFYQVVSKIVAGDYTGRSVFMKLYLGTKDDPHAEDPATTRKPGWTRLKMFWKAAKADTSSRNSLITTKSVVGNQMQLKVIEKMSEKTGNPFNEVIDYYDVNATIPAPGQGAFAVGGIGASSGGASLGFSMPQATTPCPASDCGAQLTPAEFTSHIKANHTSGGAH